MLLTTLQQRAVREFEQQLVCPSSRRGVKVTPFTRRRLSRLRDARSGDETALRLLRDDLAVLPKIHGRAVHAGDFSRGLSGSSHSASDVGGEALMFFGSFAFSCHGPRSNNLGVASELS